LLTDDLDLEAIEAARDDPAAPTDAKLREQAKELGLPVPPPRKGTRERFRDDMFDLLMGR
jgi:hypothetical protein